MAPDAAANGGGGDAAAAAAAADVDWPGVLFTDAFRDKVRGAKVLAVGAGGIGCELLKTLALTGFREIETIDLDTIETSNLNRQFLFRRAHVGQSKARVAAGAVTAFAPAGTRITAHQANVKEPRFGLDYVGRFDLVLNGLDNLDARRHVNRLCVAAGVPLVESGTAGYMGQVSVHVKGRTECYECTPRRPQTKSYPICTLRNTPDKPVHCVVWAKELLFARLFGKVEVSDLDEGAAAPTATAALQPGAAADAATADGADAEAAAAAKAKAAAEEAAEAASFFRRREAEGETPLAYATRVFDRLYREDIAKVGRMEELWKARAPPAPLDLAALLPDPAAAVAPVLAAAADAAAADGAAAGSGGVGSPSAGVAAALGLAQQGVWPLADAARVFVAAVVAFHTRRRAELGAAVFDKDDQLAVDFVTAASNLRAACYGIPQQSAFDAKGMAGNIIHAIATTNAIIAGLIVSEALKLLAGAFGALRTTFLRVAPTTIGSRRTGRALGLVYGEAPAAPSARCMVCGKAQLSLAADTRAMTLQQLVDRVLKARLAVNAPSLNTPGGFWYEEGDDLDADEAAASAALLPRALADLPGGGLAHGSIVAVGDQSQSLSFDLIISHRDDIDAEAHPEGFVLAGDAPAPQADAEEAEKQPQQQQQPQQQVTAAAAGAAAGKKRGREEGAEAAAAGEQQQAAAANGDHAKRRKAGDGNGGGGDDDDDGAVIVVSDDDAGAGAANGNAAAGDDGDGDDVIVLD